MPAPEQFYPQCEELSEPPPDIVDANLTSDPTQPHLAITA
jgi:hypothetical protein